MNKLFYFSILLFCSLAVANPSLTDQLNALDNAQNQAIAEERARAEAAYNAQLAEQRRLEQIAAKEREADRRAQQKAREQQAAAAKAAAAKAEAKERAAEDERLRDKLRVQTQEDEEREYLKQQSALKIQQEELELQRLKAKADLEAAIARDRIKSVEADTAIARKKELTEIDVVQSGADTNRALGNGVDSYLSGLGNEGLYKFLVVISLIILVLIIGIIAWRYSIHQRSRRNEVLQRDGGSRQGLSESEILLREARDFGDARERENIF